MAFPGTTSTSLASTSLAFTTSPATATSSTNTTLTPPISGSLDTSNTQSSLSSGKTITPASSNSSGTTGIVLSGTGPIAPTFTPNVSTSQPSSSSRSTGEIIGIVFGVVIGLLICLRILLRLRYRLSRRSFTRSENSRRQVTEAAELRVAPGNGGTPAPLLLSPPVSGQDNWTSANGGQAGPVRNNYFTESTDNGTKHILSVSNAGSESVQPTGQPMSSMMQEMDSLRARIAQLEQRQQHGTRDLNPPDVDSIGVGDTQSAPPAYSDNGHAQVLYR